MRKEVIEWWWLFKKFTDEYNCEMQMNEVHMVRYYDIFSHLHASCGNFIKETMNFNSLRACTWNVEENVSELFYQGMV